VSSAAPVEEASTPPSEQTSRKSLLQRILTWLTAGYPSGVPPTERYALIALLRRTLTDDEVKEVITNLTAEDSPALEDGIITDDEIQAAVATVLEDAPPSDDSLRTVSVRLAAAGWPLEGSFAQPDSSP
jgi:hypothetical protein